MTEVEYLREIASALDRACRDHAEGAAMDVPEGSRTIRMSTTWAKQTAECLCDIADELEQIANVERPVRQ